MMSEVPSLWWVSSTYSEENVASCGVWKVFTLTIWYLKVHFKHSVFLLKLIEYENILIW